MVNNMELKLRDMERVIGANHRIMETLFYDYSKEWLETNEIAMSKRVKIEWDTCTTYENFKIRLRDLEVYFGENYVLGVSDDESVLMFKWYYIKELLSLINSYEVVQEALNRE